MPCRGPDITEPTQRDRESQRVCQCLVYILSKFKQPVEDWMVEGAEDCCPDKLDMATSHLCGWLKHAVETGREDEIVYDARSRDARNLADWWEDHQEMDREREEEEQREARKAKTKERALGKLTDEEKEALEL